MSNQNYETGRIAIDAVIFTIIEDKLCIYLHEREIAPFKNKMELLGGLLLKEEKSEATLARKLKQTIGDAPYYFEQFHTFTDPNRDPRIRTISIGYIALVNQESLLDPKDFYAIQSLPNLAFDHNYIVDKAYGYLKEHLNSLIVKQFMPAYFPLNDLQKVYETILNTNIDNRNFRRKMIQDDIVKETKQIQTGVNHRPAKLYTFNKKALIQID